MNLSSEDALRLNVLLANEILAVRIDESSMTVHGLSASGETSVRLNPTGRDDPYLRQVRELISTQILGSPGGYPVYLQRWTRMGQARDESLERLLMLGEPEAVVAVVHATGLSTELARRAWWAMPNASNARRMLQRNCVTKDKLGRELANYLIEYLPFETDPQDMIESIRLILQPGLIDSEQRDKIWARAKHKNTYYVGFIQALPDELPEPVAAHPASAKIEQVLEPLLRKDNPYARQLCRTLSSAGQTLIKTVETVLNKPANQEVVVALLNTFPVYFDVVRPSSDCACGIDELIKIGQDICDGQAQSSREPDAALDEALQLIPEYRQALAAMITLSMIDEKTVTPIFARTDAIGSLMRRKLEPVTLPLKEQLACLRDFEHEKND